jgi:hypothetical protein
MTHGNACLHLGECTGISQNGFRSPGFVLFVVNHPRFWASCAFSRVCCFGCGCAVLCYLLVFTSAIGLAGQTPPAPDSDPAAPDPRTSTNLPPLKVVGPGILQLGQVRLDKQQRTVSFPALLNMSEGGMEYFLVTAYGKTHESLLRTDVSPFQIQVAMLLLNARGANTNRLSSRPPEYGGSPGFPITGDPVVVEIKWRENGKPIVRGAEELLAHLATGAPRSKGRWVYNGSAVWEGTFLAQSTGSLVSLITDPAALINRVGPGQDEGPMWTAHAGKLPPADVPVEVTIRLTPALPKK